MDRMFRLGALFVAAAIACTKLILLVTGSVHNPPGDASVRVIVALRAATSPFEFVLRDMWTINWPPGQFMVLVPIFWISDLLTPGRVNYPSVAAGTGAVVYSIGLILLYRFVVYIVRRDDSAVDDVASSRDSRAAMAGLTAVVAFGGASLPSALSFTAQSESIAFPLVVVAAHVTVRYFRRLDNESTRSDFFWLCVAWLAASLVRTDVVYLAAWLVVPIIYLRRFGHALVFTGVVASFTVLKAWIGARNGSIQYLDYAVAQRVPPGLHPFLDFFRILTPRFSSWLHPVLWFIAVAGSVGMWIARRRIPVGLLLATAYLASYLTIVTLGLQSPIDRFLYLVALFLCVALGEVVGAADFSSGLTGNARRARSWVVASMLLGAVVATGTVRFIGTTEVASKNVSTDVLAAEAWLSQNSEPEDRVLFDFIRFNGAYLNASLQKVGAPQDDFDYTSFYTRIPYVDRSARLVRTEAGAEVLSTSDDQDFSALMAQDAAMYMRQYDPRLFVLATEALARTFRPTDPRLLAPVQWEQSGDQTSDGPTCVSAVDILCVGTLTSTGGDPVESRRVRLVYSNTSIIILEKVDSPTTNGGSPVESAADRRGDTRLRS